MTQASKIDLNRVSRPVKDIVTGKSSPAEEAFGYASLLAVAFAALAWGISWTPVFQANPATKAIVFLSTLVVAFFSLFIGLRSLFRAIKEDMAEYTIVGETTYLEAGKGNLISPNLLGTAPSSENDEAQNTAEGEEGESDQAAASPGETYRPPPRQKGTPTYQ